MKYPPPEEVLHELYGALQTFRGLGFPSDNLYVAFGLIATGGPFEGRRCVGVQLRYRGKEFYYQIAPVKNSRKFEDRWRRFAEKANEEPDDPKLERIIKDSFCRQNMEDLVVMLHAKGMDPPLGSN